MHKILIYSPVIDGHYLEYLTHLYKGATERSENQYIFCVPELYREKGYIKDWSLNDKIIIDFIPNEKCNAIKHSSMIKQRWIASKDVWKKYKKYDADRIILLTLMLYFPFLPLMLLFTKARLHGIIYNIFLYQWKEKNIFGKAKDYIFYLLYAKMPTIERIYMLNDTVTYKQLNRYYNTKKFSFLPDPFNETCYEAQDIREKLCISDDKIIFLLFGVLAERKGLLMVTEAISKLSPEKRERRAFVFAGRVDSKIKDKFYTAVNNLNDTCQIIVQDMFCPYEHIYDLCKTCDVILVPYSNTSTSSGCIGYADKYGKPVIGPKDGLLGEIIRKYHMGIDLENLDAESLSAAMALDNFSSNKERLYSSSHTVKEFSSTILKI